MTATPQRDPNGGPLVGQLRPLAHLAQPVRSGDQERLSATARARPVSRPARPSRASSTLSFVRCSTRIQGGHGDALSVA